MKQTTRVLSLLLALLMVFSCTAVAANALTVTATYNDADLEGAEVKAGGEIKLVFSANVTDDSVMAGNVGKIKVKLRNEDGSDGAEITNVQVGTGADENTFLVKLGSDLAKGAYKLTIGKELVSADGQKLGKKTEFTFTVKGSGSGGGEKPLKVDSVTVNDAPLEGAEINAGDTIVILFTNGMTEHGADSAKLIRVLQADGSEVPCEVTYPVDKSDDLAKKQFTVKLGDDLEGGSYTLVLGADIQANNGTKLGEDVKIAFTVKAAQEPEELTLWARIVIFFSVLFDLFYLMRFLSLKEIVQVYIGLLKCIFGSCGTAHPPIFRLLLS